MRLFVLGFTLAALASAQPLSGTKTLDIQGDPAQAMVEGITRYLLTQTTDGIPGRAPSRDRLREILGAVDKRVPFAAPELIATAASSAPDAGDRHNARALLERTVGDGSNKPKTLR